jgi:hypothetical protein
MSSNHALHPHSYHYLRQAFAGFQKSVKQQKPFASCAEMIALAMLKHDNTKMQLRDFHFLVEVVPNVVLRPRKMSESPSLSFNNVAPVKGVFQT